MEGTFAALAFLSQRMTESTSGAELFVHLINLLRTMSYGLLLVVRMLRAVGNSCGSSALSRASAESSEENTALRGNGGSNHGCWIDLWDWLQSLCVLDLMLKIVTSKNKKHGSYCVWFAFWQDTFSTDIYVLYCTAFLRRNRGSRCSHFVPRNYSLRITYYP
jgi:hypothetical protein